MPLRLNHCWRASILLAIIKKAASRMLARLCDDEQTHSRWCAHPSLAF
jgi:hypothetical protein